MSATNDDPRERDAPDGLDALPGLGRIAVSVGWRTSGWALQTSVRASRRLLEAASSPESAAHLAQDLRHAVQDAVRELLDSEASEQDAEESHATDRQASNGSPSSTHSLREEGEVLLRKSRDVRYHEEAHPAYERILSELAPDEGRILRMMLVDGPQPAVDVRTGGPLGLLRSRLIAPGQSMIGARAGCRYGDRVPAYLNNLFRLGMIWFSRETLPDPLRYQVLEAQPDVLAAIHSVGQAKVVRRSIHLTPFGEDFCRVCLSPDAAELDRLPAHSAPPKLGRDPQPPADPAGPG